jgi:membrane associated rhomboid family serine protease
MQFDVPDPRYTGSTWSRAHFRLAVKLALVFVAVLWAVFALNVALDIDPDVSGIRPRLWEGLPGIVFAPLVHGGFEHLVSNTPPLVVLITAMVFLYPSATPRVLPAVWLVPGVFVWLFGRESVHFGASGLVYGLASYVFVAGVLRRDRRAIAAALAVWFLYGSLVWGVLPAPTGVSWETHLSAAVVGVVLAVALRRRDVPPRKRYGWEGDRAGEADAPPALERAEDADEPAPEAR